MTAAVPPIKQWATEVSKLAEDVEKLRALIVEGDGTWLERKWATEIRDGLRGVAAEISGWETGGSEDGDRSWLNRRKDLVALLATAGLGLANIVNAHLVAPGGTDCGDVIISIEAGNEANVAVDIDQIVREARHVVQLQAGLRGKGRVDATLTGSGPFQSEPHFPSGTVGVAAEAESAEASVTAFDATVAVDTGEVTVEAKAVDATTSEDSVGFEVVGGTTPPGGTAPEGQVHADGAASPGSVDAFGEDDSHE